MGKAKLGYYNFISYSGASSIIIKNKTRVSEYIDELSTDDSNNIYLVQQENIFTITSDKDDNIYLNSNMSGFARHLTSLQETDVLNKQKINYHYVTNMHTAFANCFSLAEAPVSAKRVRSMYGTYYNCGALEGAAAVNANVNNLIGTYYNTPVTQTPLTTENGKMLIDGFYNCTLLTGSPTDIDLAKSLYNAYYNCYLIEGNPANCNSAIVTTNAYYNCSNLYGDFYWCNDAFDQADKINAVNMFYNRNCDNKLNIWVRPNSSILNCLLNYSSTYGNIYGLGDITWRTLVNENNNTYYNNELYNTNIYVLFNKVILPPNIFAYYNAQYRDHSLMVDNYYDIGNTYRYEVNDDSGTWESYDFTIPIIEKVINQKYIIPSDYVLEETVNASNDNNFMYYFNKYVKWENYYYNKYVHSLSSGSTYLEMRINIQHFILQSNTTFTNYSLLKEFYFNNHNNLIFRQTVVLNDSNKPNDFQLFLALNSSDLTQLMYTFNSYRYKKDTVVTFICPNNVINMIGIFKQEDTDWSYYYGYPSFTPQVQWGSGLVEALNYEWRNTLNQHFAPTYTLSTKAYNYSNGVHENYNIFIKPNCGPNVINMGDAYRNCHLYQNKIDFGLKVEYAGWAYSGTDCNGETIYFPLSLKDASHTFAYCEEIYNTKNLIIYHNLMSLRYTFFSCNNLIELGENTNLDFTVNNLIRIDGCFRNCHNLVHGLNMNLSLLLNHKSASPTGAYTMFFSEMYVNCTNLRYSQLYPVNSAWQQDQSISSLKFDLMYCNCVNLIKCEGLNNYSYLYNNSYSMDFTRSFENCYNLIDDVNIKGETIFATRAFLNCYSITKFNLISTGGISSYRQQACIYNIGYVCQNCYNLISANVIHACQFVTGMGNSETNNRYGCCFKECYNLIYLNLYGFHMNMRRGQHGPYMYIHDFCVNCYNLPYVKSSIKQAIFALNSFVNCYNFKELNTLITFTNNGNLFILNNAFINCQNLHTIFANSVLYYHPYQKIYTDNLNLNSNYIYLTITNQEHLSINNIYINARDNILYIKTYNCDTISITEQDLLFNTNIYISSSNIISVMFNTGYGNTEGSGTYTNDFWTGPFFRINKISMSEIINNNFNYFNLFKANLYFNYTPTNFSTIVSFAIPTLNNILDSQFLNESGAFNFRELNFIKYFSTTPDNIYITSYFYYVTNNAEWELKRLSNYLINTDYQNTAYINIKHLSFYQAIPNTQYWDYDSSTNINNYMNDLSYKDIFGQDTTNISILDTSGDNTTDGMYLGTINYTFSGGKRIHGSIFYLTLRRDYPYFGDCQWDDITHTYQRINQYTSRYQFTYKNTVRNIIYKGVILSDLGSQNQQIIDFIHRV